MKNMLKIRFLTPLALLALATIASAETRYEVINIGTLPGSEYSYVSAINNHNRVVGTSYSFGTQRGFLWRQDWGMTEVHGLGYEDTSAWDINDNDFVVGYMNDDGFERGFTYKYGAWWHNNAIDQSSGAITRGINNLNQSVGSSGWAEDAKATGWLLGSQGFALPDYGGDQSSGAFRINDSGESVGAATQNGVRRATWFRNNNTVFDLHGMIQGATLSHAADINNANWIVGHANINGTQDAFVFNLELGMQVISGPGTNVQLNGISMSGSAVGSIDASAAVWNLNDGLVDMNTLIDPDSNWILTSAKDINDLGWIVGQGYHNGVYTSFLARPTEAVPEPASVTILALGVGGLIARRRKAAH